jgi:ABC-type transport system involved in Fe-S cluster assembly fused permease/ATPase subunit
MGDMLRALVPFLSRWKGRVAAALALLLVGKATTVGVPLVLQQVVDQLDGAPETIVVPLALLLAYGAMRFGGALLRELQSVVFAPAQNGIMRQLSVDVLEHLHRLPLSFHLSRKTGAVARDIGRGTSSVSTLLNYLLFNIVPTLVEVAMVAAVLITQYSASFAIVTVVTFAAYVVLTFSLTQWRIRFRTEMNQRDSQASSEAIDSLLNFETVKYFVNERFEVQRYDNSLRGWADAATQSQNSLSLLNLGQSLIIAIGVTVMMVLAAQGVQAGTMTVGDLVAVNAFLIQVFIPLGFLGTVYSMLKQSAADMERMFALLRTPLTIVDPVNPTALPDGPLALHLEDVAFGYQTERPILKGLTLDVPAGHHVAVVGPSGAGKSTLARLLFRFYDVNGGAVSVGGVDVRQLRQDDLRRSVGIVPQDCVLFNDTIRYNLRYARPDASDAQILDAARMANIDGFIASLPDGLDTLVGERGLKLSGGEKQRMAIARALLKEPRILIFDEATSSLDSGSEQAILHEMRQAAQGRTTLTIAHRLSTIVDSDRIVVLRDGTIAEQGTHAELLERNGTYAEMWNLQQSHSGGEAVEAGAAAQ